MADSSQPTQPPSNPSSQDPPTQQVPGEPATETSVEQKPDPVADPEVTQSIEQDVDMNAGGENPPQQADAENMVAPGNPLQDAPVDAAAPSKKETSLREFLGKMDDYAPIVCFPVVFPSVHPGVINHRHKPHFTPESIFNSR